MIIIILDYYILQNMYYFNILNIFILKKLLFFLYRPRSVTATPYVIKYIFELKFTSICDIFFKPSHFITPSLLLREL